MILIGGGIALFVAACFMYSNSSDAYGFALGKFLTETGSFALILFGLIHVWISLRRPGSGMPDAGDDVKDLPRSSAGGTDTSIRMLKLWFFAGMFGLTVIIYCVG